MRTPTSQSGFSVLEALVSMTIFVAALAAVLVTYSSSKRLFVRGERRVEIQQHARWAMAEMSYQVRMAGYFPENFADPPAAPLLTDPVRIASNGALAFFGDADNSGGSSVFLYCLDGETLRRGRGPAAAASSYICSSGDVLAENVIDLHFTFYDDAGNPVPSPPAAPYNLDGQIVGSAPDMSVTAQRDQVRRVVITLTVREELQHGEQALYTLTSDVRMRNAG